MVRRETVVADAGPQLFFEVIESQRSNALSDLTDTGDVDGEEQDAMTVSTEVQEKAALQAIEGYVKGLLSNTDSMTLERLFTLLKMLFEGAGNDDLLNRVGMNILSLRKFLATMVETEKIDLVDNVYRLHK